jgi:methionyl-tRNA synthetase
MSASSYQESVAQRAFELFQKRGGIQGHDQEDWYQAEQEVLGQQNKAKGKKRQGGKSE